MSNVTYKELDGMTPEELVTALQKYARASLIPLEEFTDHVIDTMNEADYERENS